MKREKRPDKSSGEKNTNNGTSPAGVSVSSGSNAGASAAGYMEYVAKFSVQKGEAFSHTRIPDKSLSIGGAFMISRTELPAFYARYYKHVFVDKKQEYLTEKQQPTNGPGLIDFDFRYASDVEERLHTKSNIMDVVSAYMRVITSVYNFSSSPSSDDAAADDGAHADITIPFYVFEKPTVNMQPEFTKDGIHMLIGMKMERAVQMLLREELLHELPELLSDLPLVNTWEQVYDDGIVKGHTNWQLYGSRKPNNKAYELKYIFEMKRNS
jgi:hypothetical protein